MAKRNKISRFNLKEGVEATKQVSTPKIKIVDSTKEKVNSRGRVKITTMIDPELRDELKLLAVQKRCNLSDILEEVIRNYLKT